jgi:hypothetical protein
MSIETLVTLVLFVPYYTTSFGLKRPTTRVSLFPAAFVEKKNVYSDIKFPLKYLIALELSRGST